VSPCHRLKTKACTPMLFAINDEVMSSGLGMSVHRTCKPSVGRSRISTTRLLRCKNRCQRRVKKRPADQVAAAAGPPSIADAAGSRPAGNRAAYFRPLNCDFGLVGHRRRSVGDPQRRPPSRRSAAVFLNLKRRALPGATQVPEFPKPVISFQACRKRIYMIVIGLYNR